MERKIYQMTEKQIEKYQPFNHDYYEQSLAAFDVNKEKLGKKFGLKKRDYASTMIRQSREYAQGMWQARLDRFMNVNYIDDKSNKYYSLGYYTAWNESGINGIENNPNFTR